MANLALNMGGVKPLRYLKASGAGTNVDPYILETSGGGGGTVPTVIYNGLTNVTTAGTRVTLAASQAILSGVTVKAKTANTGVIYVGNATVAAANGFALAAGEQIFLEVANLNTVNLDASVSGEGVTWIAQ